MNKNPLFQLFNTLLLAVVAALLAYFLHVVAPSLMFVLSFFGVVTTPLWWGAVCGSSR